MDFMMTFAVMICFATHAETFFLDLNIFSKSEMKPIQRGEEIPNK